MTCIYKEFPLWVQEEYVYDYQYAGSHLADNTDDDLEVDSVDVDVHQEKNSFQEVQQAVTRLLLDQ